jgi:hypothetical protein
MYIQCKMASPRQTLLPLFKEDWPDGTVLTPEEETYQEHWGEYEAWWYPHSTTPEFDDRAWWFAQQQQVHPEYVGVELIEHYGICMRTGQQDYEMHYTRPAIVCLACHRCFDTGVYDYIGTWDGAIPPQADTFKCFFCGPPLPAGKQCADPVMFHRWNDFERVRLGEPGGVLTIVHATYGGVMCPERDVTDKMRRIIQFQRRNMDRQGYIDVPHGIHEWIGDPEVDTAKTLRVWFTMRTREERERDERERWALGQLQRFSNRWRELYYAPGGVFEARAARRFERLCQ